MTSGIFSISFSAKCYEYNVDQHNVKGCVLFIVPVLCFTEYSLNVCIGSFCGVPNNHQVASSGYSSFGPTGQCQTNRPVMATNTVNCHYIIVIFLWQGDSKQAAFRRRHVS